MSVLNMHTWAACDITSHHKANLLFGNMNALSLKPPAQKMMVYVFTVRYSPLVVAVICYRNTGNYKKVEYCQYPVTIIHRKLQLLT